MFIVHSVTVSVRVQKQPSNRCRDPRSIPFIDPDQLGSKA